MKFTTKRAIIGLVGTTIASVLVGTVVYSLAFIVLHGFPVERLWGSTAVLAIGLTWLFRHKVVDRQIQDVMVAIPIVLVVIGVAPAIYLKDAFGIPRYPAEDRLVKWFESMI